MSDGQFVILIAVIIGSTAYMASVVARATKATCEHMMRAANRLNETLNTVLPNEPPGRSIRSRANLND
jgi:hypothetical protein